MINDLYSNDPMGYYKILDLNYTASDSEIKQNYRDKAKLWHPDHNTGKEATENFQKLAVAYDILKDSQSRLIYDLMSQAYHSKNFPDIFSLKPYKDRKGMENPFLRTFSLYTVVGKIISYSAKKRDEICNSAEASGLVFKTSLNNWILGWWSIPSFFKNISAIKYNYSMINKNKQENLTLLIHNAVAYSQDNKKDKAVVSAVQAKKYANSYQHDLLERFIRSTGFNFKGVIPGWNYARLKLIQLIIPTIILILCLLPLSTSVVTDAELWGMFNKKKEITYYQEVKFKKGARTFDDQVVARVLNIPVDVYDRSRLYHLKSKTKVMYGPSEEFDILKEVPAQTTVRLTGITPDNNWFRIMIDDGNMGFVRKEDLRKGIGSEIPANSKIYALPSSE